jgi:uncharacterized membrane protein affecting hemolysin expression
LPVIADKKTDMNKKNFEYLMLLLIILLAVLLTKFDLKRYNLVLLIPIFLFIFSEKLFPHNNNNNNNNK